VNKKAISIDHKSRITWNRKNYYELLVKKIIKEQKIEEIKSAVKNC
jgi:hypothetical protein